MFIFTVCMCINLEEEKEANKVSWKGSEFYEFAIKEKRENGKLAPFCKALLYVIIQVMNISFLSSPFPPPWHFVLYMN